MPNDNDVRLELQKTKETVALYRTIVALQDEIANLKEGKRTLRYTNARLLETNERYKNALKFYAYSDYNLHIAGGFGKSIIDYDGGNAAREALKEPEITTIIEENS